MKKTIIVKKTLSIVLSIVLLSLSIINTLALASENPDKDGIIAALQRIENVKSDIGLDGIDFSDFYIGSAIYAYEYTVDGLVNPVAYYPLLIHDVLVAFAVKVNNADDIFYQITTAFINDINDNITNDTPFALLYDYNKCYLYYDDHLLLIAESSIESINRLVLFDLSDISDQIEYIELNRINGVEYLAYNTPIQSRTPIYYQCNVQYVTQNPFSNLCWAASSAMILNCLLNTSAYTAEGIARTYFGTNFNQPMNTSRIPEVLGKDDFAYSYKSYVPNENVILKNIRYGWPIFMYCFVPNNNGLGHDVVVYGINTIGGYIYLMDPEFGAATAQYSNGQYTYYSTSADKTLSFEEAVCHYWQ